jgi:FkbM family methyltransferase
MRSSMGEVLAHLVSLGFQPKTVIDVGVGGGTYDLYESFPQAVHLLVEPLAEFQQVLDGISRRYRAEYVVAAAGASEGMATLNVHSHLEGSSLLREKGYHDDIAPRRVPLVTLDSLCRSRRLTGPFLLKVDVQGGELEVLKGASEVMRESDLVILEVSLFEFVEGGPQFYEVVSFMKERGFVVYDISGGHTRPLDAALAQVDLTFVKENGWFRQSHLFDPPASAEKREGH